jgi:hypothetical protein
MRQKEALFREKSSAVEHLAQARAEREATAELARRLEADLAALRDEARGLAARGAAAEERGVKAARAADGLAQELQLVETQVALHK